MVGKFHELALNEFYCNNGTKLSTMLDLAKLLEVIDKNTFSHHVNLEKNDFSNWLATEFKEKKLSDELKKANTINGMELILLRNYIKRL